nr:RNA-directed DNA polymerase, eukaryota [Tanacetum cinerariifolium]
MGETMDIEENFVSSFAQKRLYIKTKQADNILEKLKVTFKGKVYMARAKELFTWTSIFLDHKESEYISDDESLHDAKNKSVGSQHGEDDLVDDSDVEGVSETFFGDKHPSPNNSVCNNSEKVVEQQSEDLFCIYDVLNKKPKGVAQDSDSSLSHPPGFTPEVLDFGSVGGYDSVEQFMGYAMEGCMKDIEHIIGTQGVDAIPNEYSLIKYSRSWSQDEKEWSSLRLFNHFITSSGLVDVKLEGYSFTWAHPSATKMSKLDHFLVSEVADMDRSVSRDEIHVAVWNYGENKSPVPDRYTFEFFMRYWRFISSDFYSAVECFFESGSFSKGSNSSFIDLIPKVTNAKFVTDFRSISLIGCVYKVVTKILANRLATVISNLVSNIQLAFVANRQIIDGPFILNELLAWCKRKKKQAMIFKVDFAKAYDSVRWDYLLDVLQAFGFGPNWCK